MSTRKTNWIDPKSFPRDPLNARSRTGLILAGMGGPDGPDSVGPFLRNLFRDPAILSMPRPLARMISFFIVRKRLDAVRERYRQIGHGGGSPQLDWTRRQGDELARLMNEGNLHVLASVAMRYWHPFPGETIEELLKQGVDQFLVVPAYPQYASATSGSVLAEVCHTIRTKQPEAPIHCVAQWHLLPGYVDTLASRAETVLREWAKEDADPGSCALLYVAHSLPERFVKLGDPYPDQTRETVKAVHGNLADRLQPWTDWWRQVPGSVDPMLAFQSKVGPVRWIGPAVQDEVKRLARAGCRRLLLMPVSFTCEHIETLHELDIELADEARDLGIETFSRCDALNLDAQWLTSMADHLGETAFSESSGAPSGSPESREVTPESPESRVAPSGLKRRNLDA